nr:hypothetical protein [Tanacetum cinerariifolium]
MLKLIDIPGMLHLERRLLKSRGCLLLVCRDDIGFKEFTIYEMKKGCSVCTEDTSDANVGKVLVGKANFDGSVHNLDHEAFASGYSCGGSLKASDASALVSPTPIINMSRAGNHEELLSRMTNNMREAAMDALIAATGGLRPKPSAVGGSKLDPSISKAKFRSLFLENLCEGVYVSILSKVVEMVFSEDGLSIIASQSNVLKESLTIGVHLIEDTRFTIKTVLIPITVVTPVVPAPIVKMTNHGFQTVGKKKKGKSKSINGGHLVKQNVK